MKKTAAFIRLIPLFLFLTSLSSCIENLEQQVDRSVKDLSQAENRIDANAANMINVLKEIKSDYSIDAVKNLINNDVTRLVSTTISATGTVFQCETDFLAKRVKLGLENTIIELKNLVLKKKGEPLLSLKHYLPTFCSCNPQQIDLNDLNPKPLIVYGYDLEDYTKLKIYTVSANGVKKDVSKLLNKPSEYNLTLNMDPAAFTGYNNVEISYNDSSLYNLLIIPKTPKICKEEEFTVAPVPQNIDFYASRYGGDPEYAGDVTVTFNAQLRLSPDRRTIICHIDFDAVETDGDTKGAYHADHAIFTAKTGYVIKEFLSPTNYSLATPNYIQKGKDPESHGGNGFVASSITRADRKGDDVPGYTGGVLYLANIRITQIEDGSDCVVKEAYINAHPNGINTDNLNKAISTKDAAIIKQIDLQKK